MSIDRTRRQAVRLIVGGGLALGSGCSALQSGGGGSPTPDAGNESYGVVARNELSHEQSVSMTVKSISGETFWEKDVTLETGGEKKWSGVITQEGKELALKAEMPPPPGGYEDSILGRTRKRERSEAQWVTPGDENAPMVANFQVILHRRNPPGGGVEEEIEMVTVTYEGEPTPGG